MAVVALHLRHGLYERSSRSGSTTQVRRSSSRPGSPSRWRCGLGFGDRSHRHLLTGGRRRAGRRNAWRPCSTRSGDRPQVRDEARQPRQQAEVHDHRASAPAWPARRRAPSLGELGYNVTAFCIHDTPRRAHSIAAQGGINAAKNYRNDGDSVYRLFYDTIKGGDYRAREANVYRLAQLSVNIIDQCVAQGVPFAREYGGLLDNRSFGGAQVSRTFYARGQTGQQLLLGAYQSLMRQVDAARSRSSRREMLDLVLVDGKARGIVVRNLVTGELESHAADAVCSAPAATARRTTSRPTR